MTGRLSRPVTPSQERACAIPRQADRVCPTYRASTAPRHNQTGDGERDRPQLSLKGKAELVTLYTPVAAGVGSANQPQS